MPDEATDPISNHLEFLGYETRTTPDGWCYSEHPKRFNLFCRKFTYGWRFHASVYIGRSLGDARAAFLEAVNSINEKSVIARFSLNRDTDGDFSIRARALFHAEYRRACFGAFMDMWHCDLDQLSDLPKAPQDDEETESTETEIADGRLLN
jgi:hypothetical protein